MAASGDAVGQESPANTPDQPRVRTWTDRSGEHQTEASLMDLKVTLKKKDGTVVTVPLESLSDADRDYLKQKIWGDDPASAPAEDASLVGRRKQRTALSQHGHNVAEINPSGGKKSSAISQAKEVVVTGVGIDPDKAMQNAFSQAIEQTVGLLVDAETAVKNDQLIRDEILTCSRGYMEKYEVVSRWQESGLHHAKIRAVVARDKLVEKLRGMKLGVQKYLAISPRANSTSMSRMSNRPQRCSRRPSPALTWRSSRTSQSSASLRLNEREVVQACALSSGFLPIRQGGTRLPENSGRY